MADELDPVEGTPDPDVQPAEGEQDPNVNDEQHEPEAIVSLASDMGWAPRDKWTGDPNEWKSATDFIRAGKDIQRGLSRELRSVREEVSRIGRTSAEMAEQVRERTIAERNAYWQRQLEIAVKDDKPDLASKAADEISKIAVAREAAKATPEDAPPPETQAWVEKNSAWFGKDRLATMRAREISDRLAKEGVSIPEQLREAERAIRKEFPEHFPAPAKQPAGVQTGQARNANPSNRQKGYADMPQDSQKLAQDYKERLGVPLEEFAKSYWRERAKDEQRRVG